MARYRYTVARETPSILAMSVALMPFSRMLRALAVAATLRAGRGFGTATAYDGVALATPLSLTVKRPIAAPLKVPLLIHSISAALTVEWGPAQG
jgi:hypothetical protein